MADKSVAVALKVGRPMAEDDLTFVKVSLPAEAILAIRRMLVIGLHAHGECARVQREAAAARELGLQVDRTLVPMMLSAQYETANFAEALAWLEHVEPIAA